MITSEKPEKEGLLARIEVPLVWFVVLAVLLALVVIIIIPVTFPDIHMTRVSFTNTYSQEGETIQGLLLTPAQSPAGPIPAVVFSHGLTADKEIYLSLYRDLARRGIAVLGIDLPGHGGSGGHSDLGGSEYTAILSAYDWLVENNSEMDSTRIAAAGHSLGGVASTQAGLLQPEKKLSAVVAIWCWQSQESGMETMIGPYRDFIGRMWPLLIWSQRYDVNDQSAQEDRDIISRVGPGAPPNYLVIVGRLDEAVSVEQEKELVARAADLEQVEPGVVYGSFEDGTARELVVTADDHVTEIFSSGVFDAMYDWLCKSFGIKPSGSPPLPLIRFSLWGLIFALVFLLSLLGLIIAFRLLERPMATPFFLTLPGPLYAPSKRNQMAAISIIFFLVISALTLPLALVLGLKVLVPFLAGDIASSIAVVRGGLALFGILIGLFLYYGIAADYASIPWTQKARAIAISAAPPLVAFALFLLLYVPLARLLYLGPALPYAWGPFLLYVALVTPLFWIEGRYFHLFLLPAFGDTVRGKSKLGYLASEAGIRGLGNTFLILPFLITRPLLIIGRPDSIRMPVLLAAFLVAFPAYFLLAWINLHSRAKKISLLLPSLAIVLAQAFVLTTIVSTR